MIKTSSIFSALIAIGILFNGCIDTGDDSSSSTSSGGGSFSMTFSNGGNNLSMTWKRSGDVVYYSHTDLTNINSQNKNRIAGTNSDVSISIECIKGIYSGGAQSYTCSADNVSDISGLSFVDGESSLIVERGQYSSADHGEKVLATVTPDGSGSYTVSY